MSSSDYGNNQKTRAIRKRTKAFMRREGRRPRILVSQVEDSGHKQWVNAFATGCADLGFDVDIGPIFQNPDETAKMAVENDVHVLAVPSSSTRGIVLRLMEALQNGRGEGIIVAAGRTIFTHDCEALSEPVDTVSDILSTNALVFDTAFSILDTLEQKKLSHC